MVIYFARRKRLAIVLRQFQRRSTGNEQEYDDSAKDDEHQGQERDGEFLDDTEEVEQDVS